MNKNAWTLAELTIAITILLVLTAASVSMTKNININQTRLNLYAAIRNLTMANIAIKEKPLSYSLFYPKSAEEHDADDTKTNDWYCMNVADAFFEFICIDLEINGDSVFFQIFHGIFAVNGASARCNNTVFKFLRTDGFIFDSDEFVGAFFFYDFAECGAFFFLDNQIRIAEIHEHCFCKKNSDCAFTRTGHSD